jgi:hypothetical protein
MGGDGGSIPRRVDMVKTKGYVSVQSSSAGSMGYTPNLQRRVEDESMDPKRQRQLNMTRCGLSGERLEDPVVVDRAGFLYSKETLIRRLLEKKERLPKHISSIKDVIEVRFKRISDHIVCPINSKELDDGLTKAIVMWPCGCALSHKAVEMTATSTSVCPHCGKSVDSQIKLFPDDKADQERQLRLALDCMHKKSKQDALTDGKLGATTSVKRKKEDLEEVGENLNKLKQSKVYSSLFHNSSNSR